MCGALVKTGRTSRVGEGKVAECDLPGQLGKRLGAFWLGDRFEREQGIDAHGPESPDALFSRARGGEFDWVLALYHDQGLIAVKTVAFGSAVNWTLGLPFIRTSVDHGTAFAIAGSGKADAGPLMRAVEGAIALAAGELPRGRRDDD